MSLGAPESQPEQNEATKDNASARAKYIGRSILGGVVGVGAVVGGAFAGQLFANEALSNSASMGEIVDHAVVYGGVVLGGVFGAMAGIAAAAEIAGDKPSPSN